MDTGLRIAAICPVENRIDLSGRGIHPQFTLRAPPPPGQEAEMVQPFVDRCGNVGNRAQDSRPAIDSFLTPAGYHAALPTYRWQSA
jgi:hypothetical protein